MVYHRSEGSGSRSDRNLSAPPSSSQPAAPNAARNAFRNDGSFLEMFKKMQEGSASGDTSDATRVKSEPDAASGCPSSGPVAGSPSESRPAPGSESLPSGSDSATSGSAAKKPQPFVGKRRGGRVLPTGVVKKKKTDEDEDEDKPKDAWSLYMAEVRRYKETSCEEDGKTRPLVK